MGDGRRLPSISSPGDHTLIIDNNTNNKDMSVEGRAEAKEREGMGKCQWWWL